MHLLTVWGCWHDHFLMTESVVFLRCGTFPFRYFAHHVRLALFLRFWCITTHFLWKQDKAKSTITDLSWSVSFGKSLCSHRAPLRFHENMFLERIRERGYVSCFPKSLLAAGFLTSGWTRADSRPAHWADWPERNPMIHAWHSLYTRPVQFQIKLEQESRGSHSDSGSFDLKEHLTKPAGSFAVT